MEHEQMKKIFFDQYVDKARDLFNITDPQKLQQIRNLISERYIETEFDIFNSVNFTNEYISPIDFWFIKDKFILNENGVLMDTTQSNEAVTAKLIKQYIDFRQVFKKMKKKSAEIGDSVNEKKYGTFEALTKLRINGSTHRAPHYGDIVMQTL